MTRSLRLGLAALGAALFLLFGLLVLWLWARWETQWLRPQSGYTLIAVRFDDFDDAVFAKTSDRLCEAIAKPFRQGDYLRPVGISIQKHSWPKRYAYVQILASPKPLKDLEHDLPRFAEAVSDALSAVKFRPKWRMALVDGSGKALLLP